MWRIHSKGVSKSVTEIQVYLKGMLRLESLVRPRPQSALYVRFRFRPQGTMGTLLNGRVAWLGLSLGKIMV